MTGYTLNGVYKEIQKLFGASVENYIVASRSMQGYEEWKIASLEERADVVKRWNILSADYDPSQSTSSLPPHLEAAPRGVFHSHHNRGRDKADSDASETGNLTAQGNGSSRAAFRGARHKISRSASRKRRGDSSSNYKKATQEPAELSSRNNSREDRLIRRAMRASLAEQQAAEVARGEHDAYDRALRASITEAKHVRKGSGHVHARGGRGRDHKIPPSSLSIEEGANKKSHSPRGQAGREPDEDEDAKALRMAIEESLKMTQQQST